MEYTTRYMDEEILKEIISWKYEGEYKEYNLEPYETLVERNSSIVKPEKRENYLCYFKDKELIGYTNIMKKNTGDIFLGIGLAPKYCGKGYGSQILNNSIKEAMNKYPDSKITLQVRAWNIRAIKCYEKYGFKILKKEKVQDRNGIEIEFVFMEFEK